MMGLVQSVTPAGLTINLGRIEGVLARKEMLPNERYEAGKQVRAFVIEVRRGGRGPQINLSRTHKNMLRRLLEIEVPEIFDGKVEIKSITREPGSRSKVAVAAMQTGVDPVGACVGPRGTRIQGIINELSGEKIDVIEWSADPTVFITKALGPAKVLAVHPSAGAAQTPTQAAAHADPGTGERGIDKSKNATVIVPDDQLSLAIGREGQNARLAARLTGWRIDIKSTTEALNEATNKLTENPAIQAGMSADVLQSLTSLRELMVRQRAQATGLPLSPDEFLLVKRVLDAVYTYEVAQKGETPAAAVAKAVTPAPMSEAKKKAQQEAIAAIPKAAYNVALDALGVSARVLEHIQKAGILSVGQLMEFNTRGDEGFLGIEGIGPKALTEIKTALDKVVSGLPTESVAEPVAPSAEVEMQASAEPVMVEMVEIVAEVEAIAPAVVGETTSPEAEAQEFLNAIGGEEDKSEDDDTGSDKKKDKDKGKKSAKGVLVFDEELGRMVLQRPRKRQAELDEFDD